MFDDDVKKRLPAANGGLPSISEIHGLVRQQIETCRRPRHPVAPRDNAAMVQWLMNLFDAPTRGEAPQWLPSRNGDGGHYLWPYLARCKLLANKFLNAPLAYQETIIAARADGVGWRGEEADALVVVVGEFYEMREMGATAYRRDALAKMKQVLGGFGKLK